MSITSRLRQARERRKQRRFDKALARLPQRRDISREMLQLLRKHGDWARDHMIGVIQSDQYSLGMTLSAAKALGELRIEATVDPLIELIDRLSANGDLSAFETRLCYQNAFLALTSIDDDKARAFVKEHWKRAFKVFFLSDKEKLLQWLIRTKDPRVVDELHDWLQETDEIYEKKLIVEALASRESD